MSPTAHAAAPPRLIGREAELAVSRTLLDGLDDGPRGLLVEGDAGIGKTAIWRSALADAEARGYRVLRCVAEQAEARLSFVGLADLADPIADDFLDALPAPQRDALEVALVRRAGSGQPPDPTAVGAGFRALLVRAAEAGPLVLAVDDVQWLDAATARALAFAVRRLDGLPVGVLATVRTPLAEADPLGLERALGPGRLQRERLGPLGIDAVRSLIESRLGHGYRRPTLVKLAQASNGNPLFALEIARALGPAPALEAGAPLPVPENLREIVAGRIADLDPQARGALLVAAALSHPTVELVEQAASRRRAGRGGGERAAVPRGRPARVRPPAVRVGGLRAGRERPPPRAARAAGRAGRRARGARAPPGARRRGARRAGRRGARERRCVGPRPRRLGDGAASCSSRRAR